MTSPTRILGQDGRVAGIELVKMEYGMPDPDGRRAVHPIAGTEYTVEVDTVIRAIGELPEVEALVGPIGIELTDRGFIAVEPITRQTSNPKVWAGGDIVGSKGNDGAAVDGFWAAGAIDAALRGELPTWRQHAARRVVDMSH
jgi:NADPH-dependent glutamate synthase beta subunit-like oxidoreductase